MFQNNAILILRWYKNQFDFLCTLQKPSIFLQAIKTKSIFMQPLQVTKIELIFVQVQLAIKIKSIFVWAIKTEFTDFITKKFPVYVNDYMKTLLMILYLNTAVIKKA